MQEQKRPKISTGIKGLDGILYGGLPSYSSYLVRGDTGTGKTILGLNFLSAGVREGENALYISLQQKEEIIRTNASIIGIDTSGIHFLDLSPSPEFFKKAESYQFFTPEQIDSQPVTKSIIDTINRIKPARLLVDPITQLRYFALDQFHFRKQILSFLNFLTEFKMTVMLTSEVCCELSDNDLRTSVDGIIRLEHSDGHRSISIEKLHGADFLSGANTLKITDQGMFVFPRLIPEKIIKREATYSLLPSGLENMDRLLNGGIESSTITLISGPSGVGKSSLGMQFLKTGAEQGRRSVVFSFQEEIEQMVHHYEKVNIPIKSLIERGCLSIEKIEPFEFSTDQFTNLVREEVEGKKTKMIMLDSLSGFNAAIEQHKLVENLNTVGKYLQNMNVTFFIITDTSKIIESLQVSDIGVSYFADNIIVLRFMEIRSEIRKVIGVLKKRLGDFEKTFREYDITSGGIVVGNPLHNLRGILTGIPDFLE